MSAMKTLESTLEVLKTAADGVRHEVRKVSCPNVEDNVAVRVSSKRIPFDVPIP